MERFLPDNHRNGGMFHVEHSIQEKHPTKGSVEKRLDHFRGDNHRNSGMFHVEHSHWLTEIRSKVLGKQLVLESAHRLLILLGLVAMPQ